MAKTKAGKGVTEGQHSFAQIPRAEIQRSSFNRSCGTKTTFNAGDLVPVFWDEALPGDTMHMKMSLFARIATLLFPIMDNIYIDVFFFFVPNRLLWDNWEKFNGAQTNPGDSTDFLVPTVSSGAPSSFTEGSLYDYLGVPIKEDNLVCSAMFHRAYNFIWNEWFRDENLQDSITVDTGDGPDNANDYVIRKRGKRHDYFTSCLPFPQKGTAVDIPLGTSAPVTMDAGQAIVATGADPTWAVGGNTGVELASAASGTATIWNASASSSTTAAWDAPALALVTGATGVADLTAATAATINALRVAFQTQRLFERDARGGTRYTEILRAHFGVTSPDQRLQRPEYLGGGTTPLMITPVPNTSNAVSGVVGELSSFGTAAQSGMGFRKSFVEHGVILGLVASRADLNYQQGLNRAFSRSTRFDFYWPALAHIGEQAVLNKEIFADGTANDELVFGYQERYAEYRYKPSMITGKMRSAAALTLDAWHVAQDFASVPLLNDSFIQENPPMDRIVAITSEPDFLFDSFFQYTSVRPMPTYSVPGLIDHF